MNGNKLAEDRFKLYGAEMDYILNDYDCKFKEMAIQDAQIEWECLNAYLGALMDAKLIEYDVYTLIRNTAKHILKCVNEHFR